MKNKILILVVFFLAISVASSLANARELKNNLYLSLSPNSAKCFNLRLPFDIFVYNEDRIIINITTEAETNIKFINVSASPNNQVIVPLCFFSFNKQEGDYFNYTINIFSEKSGTETVRGGFCITNNTGAAIGRPEKSPCDFIIKDEKLFDIGFNYGDIIQIKKDVPSKIPLWAQSPNKLDLELTVQSNVGATPISYLLRLESGKRIPFNLDVPPLKQGNYQINLTADVVIDGKYCDSKKLPFCKKEISTNVLVDSIGLKGWYFYVVPASYSAFSSRPIEYTAVIENYESDRDFTLEVKSPQGLSSDFTKSTVKIGSQQRKEFLINITPTDLTPNNYEIEFIATGDVDRSVKSYLSVRDTERIVNNYWSNVRDQVALDLRPALEVSVRNFLDDYRKNGMDTEEYASLLDLLEKAKRGENVSVQIRNISSTLPPTRRQEPINPILIIAPIIVIIFIVSLLFYSRSRKNNQEEESNL